MSVGVLLGLIYSYEQPPNYVVGVDSFRKFQASRICSNVSDKLWEPKFHYLVFRSCSLSANVRQMILLHENSSYFYFCRSHSQFYVARSSRYGGRNYELSFILLPCHSPSVQIFFSAPLPRMPAIYVLPLMSETNQVFHSQKSTCSIVFLYFKFYIFRQVM
jgi:hypothetical protein